MIQHGPRVKSAVILCTKKSNSGFPSGGSQRVKDIIELLEEEGFDIKVAKSRQEVRETCVDLLVIVSYASAAALRLPKSDIKSIWLDLTDSWKWTRRQLFNVDIMRETLRCLRDLFNSFFFSRADLITYCSQRDLEADNLDHHSVYLLNHKTRIRTPYPSIEKRFVFVGDGDYYPNKEAVDFLVSCYRANPMSWPLYVYGQGFNFSESLEGVHFMGFEDDSEIYRELDVHVVPIWRGAGVKYKTLNPLSHNLRVISSREGANGFKQNSNLLIASNPHDFLKMMQGVQEKSFDHFPGQQISNQSILLPDQEMNVRQFLREFV